MNLREIDLIVNGLKLHVYLTGTDKPALLFAHGFTDNGRCFLPVAEQLSRSYEIVLYDARGHGRSDISQAKTTLLDLARDMAGVIEGLGLYKPCLVGHSMGAATAIVCAGLYPQLPGCAVLEDPPAFDMMSPAGEEFSEMRKKWREGAALNKQKSLTELIQLSRVQDPAWPEAERQPWAESKQQVNLKVFDDEYINMDDMDQVVSRVTCPVLILTADPDKGGLFPQQAADELVAGLPGSRHVNIPGSGHNIRREQPIAYMDAVQNFLKERM